MMKLFWEKPIKDQIRENLDTTLIDVELIKYIMTDEVINKLKRVKRNELIFYTDHDALSASHQLDCRFFRRHFDFEKLSLYTKSFPVL